jgi:hypothetical protein
VVSKKVINKHRDRLELNNEEEKQSSNASNP